MHNAEKAEEYVQNITFAVIKASSNRQTDDAGKIITKIIVYLALEGSASGAAKKGGKKKGGK